MAIQYQSGQAALEAARTAATSGGNGGGDFKFFSLKDGETAVVRFLTGMDDMHIYNHNCGLTNWEIGDFHRTQLLATGQFVCPNCKQPFAETDFVATRPAVIRIKQHDFVTSPADGTKRTFVCLKQSGLPCPICAVPQKMDEKKGKMVDTFRIAERMYGAAVVRKVVKGTRMESGVMIPVIESVENELITVKDENGADVIRPNVVLLAMGYGNFWEAVGSVHDQLQASMAGGISQFDFEITRIGSGLDTKYTIAKLSNIPTPEPWEAHAPLIPSIPEYLERIGSVEYYTKHGWLNPDGTFAAASAPAPAPAQQQYGQQYVAPAPMPQYAPAPAPQYAPAPAPAPATAPQAYATPVPQYAAPAPAPQPAPAPVQYAAPAPAVAPQQQPAPQAYAAVPPVEPAVTPQTAFQQMQARTTGDLTQYS